MRMKKFSIITIIISALLIVLGIASPLISALLIPKDAASIGIIGGADGPTAILLTSTLLSSVYGKLITLGVIALIVGVVLLIISKFKKK